MDHCQTYCTFSNSKLEVKSSFSKQSSRSSKFTKSDNLQLHSELESESYKSSGDHQNDYGVRKQDNNYFTKSMACKNKDLASNTVGRGSSRESDNGQTRFQPIGRGRGRGRAKKFNAQPPCFVIKKTYSHEKSNGGSFKDSQFSDFKS